MRSRQQHDEELEAKIGLVRNDRTAVQIGRRYSHDFINEVEKEKAPWYHRRKLWAARLRRSS